MVINLFKKPILKLMLVAFGGLLLTILLMYFQVSHLQQFQYLTHIIAQYPTLWTVLRWILIALMFGGWPNFIHYYAQKYRWENEKKQFWLSQRYRISAWLIIFELLICQNILFSLIKLF
jgi:hypothetical protein